MRNLVILASVSVLAGCNLWGWGDEKPAEPQAGATDAFVDKTDFVESRAAAAVRVASKANEDGEPAVVKNELLVAGAYLPEPSPADLSQAEKRAAKADDATYEKEVEVARKHQAETDKLWKEVEAKRLADQKRIDDLKAQVATLEKALADAEIDERNLYYAAGAITLLALGGLAIAFGRGAAGFGLIGAGAICGAIPTVLDSDYFGYIAGGGLGVAVLIGLYALWSRLRPRPCPALAQTPNPAPAAPENILKES